MSYLEIMAGVGIAHLLRYRLPSSIWQLLGVEAIASAI